jgi:predicted ATPase/class 3 adenylate cyclase
MVRPSGTVTFLFTDIEGSTRRWELDAELMRVALAEHDETLRAAIATHGGWMFKHTGDGVCAAFGSARGAVEAAVEAQRLLGLPVRMGIATGEAEQRGSDYFGPALNRAARVMAVGHGGQILLSRSTAGLLGSSANITLEDLGEHLLRDLTGTEHLYQVCALGLPSHFPALRSLREVAGNLPGQSGGLVGRDSAVVELVELVRGHRLVTLTGVGGVGKTRLAIRVAAELSPDFPDGTWLVELAPIGDPLSVPEAVASALGITARVNRTVSEDVIESLSTRRLLIVLDNCEHVVDAAALLVDQIVSGAPHVKVLATSREGLQVSAEHNWTVPPLEVHTGTASAAVELFVERARAAAFTPSESDLAVILEICDRLDGIALAIELAAARMVSMNPDEVLVRLTDRFRLLSGARRGVERHHTLRHAMQWSYDLLNETEQTILRGCAVFAGGFVLQSAANVCATDLDEYELLDVLDSLVRKSLLTTMRVGRTTRYGLLETIRQFAEDRSEKDHALSELRARHAAFYAQQVRSNLVVWDGPEQAIVTDWLDAEFANLRVAFRWATDQADYETASAIAAPTTLMAFALQRYEPASWAEELVEPVTAAALRYLPQVLTAASYCAYTGRPAAAVEYAEMAVRMERDDNFEGFAIGFAQLALACAHLYDGRIERFIEICTELANHPSEGLAQLIGRCGLLRALPAVGRAAEGATFAEEALQATRDRKNPYWIAMALSGYGRVFTDSDPQRALHAFREGIHLTQQHRLPYWEATIAREAAGLEAIHGNTARGLELFASAIDSYYQAGNIASLAATLANLAGFFERFDQPEVAATILGSTNRSAGTVIALHLPEIVARLQARLGPERFEQCASEGAALTLSATVNAAKGYIQNASRQYRARRLDVTKVQV